MSYHPPLQPVRTDAAAAPELRAAITTARHRLLDVLHARARTLSSITTLGRAPPAPLRRGRGGAARRRAGAGRQPRGSCWPPWTPSSTQPPRRDRRRRPRRAALAGGRRPGTGVHTRPRRTPGRPRSPATPRAQPRQQRGPGRRRRRSALAGRRIMQPGPLGAAAWRRPCEAADATSVRLRCCCSSAPATRRPPRSSGPGAVPQRPAGIATGLPTAARSRWQHGRAWPGPWRDRVHRERMRRWVDDLDDRVAAVPQDPRGRAGSPGAAGWTSKVVDRTAGRATCTSPRPRRRARSSRRLPAHGGCWPSPT